MTSYLDLPLLEPEDRADLRRWLEKNHAASDGVRLAIRKKGADVPGVSYEEAVEEGLCFGWIDSTARKLDDSRFTVRFSPRRPGGTWAASNKARVERLIASGCMTDAGLAAIDAAKADGSWGLLDSVDALDVPPDLAEALLSTEGAAEGWDDLSSSVKKMALYWISAAKRTSTRETRIARTATAAAEGRGPV